MTGVDVAVCIDDCHRHHDDGRFEFVGQNPGKEKELDELPTVRVRGDRFTRPR